MASPIRPGASARRAILLSAVCLMFTASTAAAFKWFSGGSSSSSPPASASPAHPQVSGQGGPDAPLSVELITLTPKGFDPGEISPVRGRFLLAVDNRSGQPDVELLLLRESGHKLREVKVPKETADWSDLFDLPPGRYVLTEAGHPEWKCGINVTAR